MIRSASTTVESLCAITSHSSPAPKPRQLTLDLPLRRGIERRRRLVEDKDRRVLQHRPRDRDPLFLTARELEPPLTHKRVIPLRQAQHEVMDPCGLGGLDHVFPCRAVSAIGDVVADRVIEEHGVLGNYADRLSQARLSNLAYVLSVNPDGSRCDVVEPEQKPRDRRFPSP